MLQHIEQAVTGAGKLIIVAAPREVGEHAGHRHRSGRTAGAHILERHHPLLFGREAVGCLAITVQGVVLAARRLPTTKNIKVGLLPRATTLASVPKCW